MKDQGSHPERSERVVEVPVLLKRDSDIIGRFGINAKEKQTDRFMARNFISKLTSGGQTGVDRAALDVGLGAGLFIGGWCPKGRRAEDGIIPTRYPLQETPSPRYSQRTKWNVRDTDGTLILTHVHSTGGTALTICTARHLHKPHLVIDLTTSPDPRAIASWLSQTGITVLNVAGPRESTHPGIYHETFDLLQKILGPHA